MKRLRTLAVTGIAAAALVCGCSTTVINQGGNTTCKDFTGADQNKQNDAVSKMLKDEHGTDPTNLEITATRISAQTYCQTLGKEDTKISESPHG